MNVELIEEKKRKVVERFGPWTAHNICLKGDVYTINKEVVGDEVKLRRILQCVSDISRRPLKSLRILDLACLEGLYAVEFARHGAKVLGIEGREPNIEKARFAKEVIALENLELVKDDVRNLSKEKYGQFDVVMCLGILYHLNVPGVFTFLEQISEVCLDFVLIDTHISTFPEKYYLYREKKYWGRVYKEHDVNSTSDEKSKRLWSSLDNPESFCFTRPSLYNVLSHVGFTSVYECHIPPEPDKKFDRVTLLAMRGQRQALFCSPLLSSQPIKDLAEKAGNLHHKLHIISRLIPASIRKVMKRFIYS
jgi:hypothetical protein